MFFFSRTRSLAHVRSLKLISRSQSEREFFASSQTFFCLRCVKIGPHKFFSHILRCPRRRFGTACLSRRPERATISGSGGSSGDGETSAISAAAAAAVMMVDTETHPFNMVLLCFMCLIVFMIAVYMVGWWAFLLLLCVHFRVLQALSSEDSIVATPRAAHPAALVFSPAHAGERNSSLLTRLRTLVQLNLSPCELSKCDHVTKIALVSM